MIPSTRPIAGRPRPARAAERDLHALPRPPREDDREPAEQARDRDRAGRVDQRHRLQLAGERRCRPGSPAIARIPHDERPRRRADSRADRYCLTYGRPTAAGGTDLPITPMTAISVMTYGQRLHEHLALVAVALDSGRQPAEEAEQQRERERAAGRQSPTMSAARPMNPRPAVMFSVNEWT